MNFLMCKMGIIYMSIVLLWASTEMVGIKVCYKLQIQTEEQAL